MAFTQNSQSGLTIAKEIIKIEISTVTGGSTEVITFDADSMLAPVMTKESLTTPNAHSEVGQQIGTKIMVDFSVIGLGETADWTAINELKAQANTAAYVKFTYRDGQTEVIDSGATGSAIMYFNVTQSNDGDGVIEQRVHGERTIANLDASVS